MKYIITEESLMSYLFEEMDAQERTQFEEALKEDTRWQEELKHMSFLRKQMGKVEDEEPDQKVVIHAGTVDNGNAIMRWLKPIGAVAAALALLMVLASILNMRMDKYDGGFSITFGQSDETERAVENEDLRLLVNDLIDQRDNQLKQQFTSFESTLNQDLANRFEGVISQVKNLNSKPSKNGVSLEELNEILETLRTEDQDNNEKMIANFFEYMSQTREKDLRMIQSGFDNMSQLINVSELERQKVMASTLNENIINQ